MILSRQSGVSAALVLGLALVAFGTSCATNSSGTGGGGSGGAAVISTGTGAGGKASSCAQDCSKIQTPQCLQSVCNEGQTQGPIGQCAVVPSDKGTTCDDSLFCTLTDTCDAGVCKGGGTNDCGTAPPPCTDLVCNEAAKSCSTKPAAEGSSCLGNDLCQVNAICQAGQCKGAPKDCSFSPYAECNSVACNPATGVCDPTPDAAKNGATCGLSGNICDSGKTCAAGTCTGGTPKDCSALNQPCADGACDANSGSCTTLPKAAGTACAQATDQCNVGMCSSQGQCQGAPVMNGTVCNDHDACTMSDVCTAGACLGGAVTGCPVYFTEGFETCPHGWTFGGDWQCGSPTVVGPAMAHTGTGLIATQLAANYNNSQEYAVAVADSPVIDLSAAVAPQLSFWVWMDTEGNTYDGFNVRGSIDGGSTYNQLVTVSPAYDLTIASAPAWGGHNSALGWQLYTADASLLAGHANAKVRFSFHSDTIISYPGVYIDDLRVAEATATALSITTPTLSNGFVGQAYSFPLARSGGSAAATWSITGGTNYAWLTVNPATGALSGTPAAGNHGPVTVTLRVQEPALPSNFDTKTYSFGVLQPLYSQNFDAGCATGWALAGDFQCGTPSVVGPATAFSGANCLATVINADYSNDDAYATTTATSPAIDLTAAQNAQLTFHTWIDTEGSSWDGFNVKVSTNNGVSFTTVQAVSPAYPLTIANEPAWGGHQSASGWQTYSADLSAFVGQPILVRFAFRSDPSGAYPGVYIDDVIVAD